MPNQYTVNREGIPEGSKRCTGVGACGEVKKLSEFYRQSGKHKSGNERTDYRPQCKGCTSRKNAEAQRLRRQQEKIELTEIRRKRAGINYASQS